MITYNDRVYYNSITYGNSIRIPVRIIYSILAICIPVVIPLPLALFVPKHWAYRYI